MASKAARLPEQTKAVDDNSRQPRLALMALRVDLPSAAFPMGPPSTAFLTKLVKDLANLLARRYGR